MFVGVDIGTQSLKAVVCDGGLAVIGSASVSPTSRSFRSPTTRTRPPTTTPMDGIATSSNACGRFIDEPMDGILDRLLSGELTDIDGGAPLSVPTRAVVIERSLAGAEAELLRGLELGDRLAVVSDPTTRDVLGERVERAIDSFASPISINLADRPHADAATAAVIAEATRDADALIAVGSGTINDLCKFVSAKAGKPYAVFATAPSMNGYSSVNAARDSRPIYLSRLGRRFGSLRRRLQSMIEA